MSPEKRKFVNSTLDSHFVVQMKQRQKTQTELFTLRTKWQTKAKTKTKTPGVDPRTLDSWFGGTGSTTGTARPKSSLPTACTDSLADDEVMLARVKVDDKVTLVRVKASPPPKQTGIPRSFLAESKKRSLSDEENIPIRHNPNVAAVPTAAAAHRPAVTTPVPPPRPPASPPVIDLTDEIVAYYTLAEFESMWHMAEEDGQYSIEEIEKGSLVRSGNTKVETVDSIHQKKAQYGRILFGGMQFLLEEVLKVDKSQVFLDIGHGLGNTCLQAAYTIGCEARGIEIDYRRNLIATEFAVKLEHIRTMLHGARDDRNMMAGELDLRHGRMEAPEHREFLTNPQSVTKVFVNNFNGVFADKCEMAKQTYFLDNYLAGIFAQMKVGSILVTLHPLDLGPSQSGANQRRRQHGLSESANSSFYEDEKVSLGMAKDVVSWSQYGGCGDIIDVYKYTRVKQETSDGDESVFLCCNPICDKARLGTPITATVTVTVAGGDQVVMNSCDCNLTSMKLRCREQVDRKKK